MFTKPLNDHEIKQACVILSQENEEMAFVFNKYGQPPLWARPTGFGTLLNIILEQQVSLASAKACFDKLQSQCGVVTPEKVLKFGDSDLKTMGFSRQKAAYARYLSEAVIDKRINLDALHEMADLEAKAELVKLKGVGDWTSDVYMLMAMLRPDIMPKGDVALHAAYKKLVNAEKRPGSDEFLLISEKWKPFRSVAARLLWHFYLSEKALRTGTRA